MRGTGAERLWAASGLGFAVLILASSLAPGAAPVYEDLAPTIAGYYTESSADVELAELLLGFAVIEALIFIGYFRSVLAAAEDSGVLTSVAWGGGLLGIGFAALSGVLQGAAAKLPPGTDPAAFAGLHQAGVEAVHFAEICLALFLLASGLAILATRVLPAWVAWFGFLPVVLWLIGFFEVVAPEQDTGPLGGAGFVAFLAFVIWSAVTSFVLVRRVVPREAPASEPG